MQVFKAHTWDFYSFSPPFRSLIRIRYISFSSSLLYTLSHILYSFALKDDVIFDDVWWDGKKIYIKSKRMKYKTNIYLVNKQHFLPSNVRVWDLFFRTQNIIESWWWSILREKKPFNLSCQQVACWKSELL